MREGQHGEETARRAQQGEIVFFGLAQPDLVHRPRSGAGPTHQGAQRAPHGLPQGPVELGGQRHQAPLHDRWCQQQFPGGRGGERGVRGQAPVQEGGPAARNADDKHGALDPGAAKAGKQQVIQGQTAAVDHLQGEAQGRERQHRKAARRKRREAAAAGAERAAPGAEVAP